MDDKVFASRDMTEAMSLNDRIDTIGVVDIFAVDDAQKPSLFPNQTNNQSSGRKFTAQPERGIKLRLGQLWLIIPAISVASLWLSSCQGGGY